MPSVKFTFSAVTSPSLITLLNKFALKAAAVGSNISKTVELQVHEPQKAWAAYSD